MRHGSSSAVRYVRGNIPVGILKGVVRNSETLTRSAFGRDESYSLERQMTILGALI